MMHSRHKSYAKENKLCFRLLSIEHSPCCFCGTKITQMECTTEGVARCLENRIPTLALATKDKKATNPKTRQKTAGTTFMYPNNV